MTSVIELYNISTRDFVNDFFGRDDRLQECLLYIEHWSRRERSPIRKCGICRLIMKTDDEEAIKKMNFMTELFARLPMTPTIVIMGWHEITNIFKRVHYDDVHPVDVYSHFMLRACPDLLLRGKNIGINVAGVMDICMLYSSAAYPVAEEPSKDNDSDDDMAGDIAPPTKTCNKNDINDIKYFIKTILRQNRCGCSSDRQRDCLFGNNGDITKCVQGRKLIQDGRLLVDYGWFKRNRGHLMSFEDFLTDINYGAGQPGAN